MWFTNSDGDALQDAILAEEDSAGGKEKAKAREHSIVYAVRRTKTTWQTTMSSTLQAAKARAEEKDKDKVKEKETSRRRTPL